MCFCSSALLVRLNSSVLLGNMVISVWQSIEGTGNLSSAHEPAFSVALGNTSLLYYITLLHYKVG